MLLLSRLRILAGLTAVALALAWGAPVPAQAKKGFTKNVTFKSYDGVELSGTLYPNPGGKRDATVLLLHNFDLKKGGNSQQEGWTNLATALQFDGYVVLQFDFRGFGDSKTVDTNFWNQKYNNQFIRRRGVKPPTSIDHKDFSVNYLPYLVNDIAAAKAYLDQLNDNNGCNTSSLFVIGAGDGATLGAMWMANETRRRRDTNMNQLLAAAGAPPKLGDPESDDLAAGVWLSISPALGGTRSVPVARWVAEAGKARKVPMAFVFGKGDARGDATATNLLKAIKPTGGGKSKDFPNTGIRAIPDTKLSGEKLLDIDLETLKWVVGNYMNGVMDARGAKIRTTRDLARSAYWYADPKTGRPLKINKSAGDKVPSVDLTQLLSAF